MNSISLKGFYFEDQKISLNFLNKYKTFTNQCIIFQISSKCCLEVELLYNKMKIPIFRYIFCFGSNLQVTIIQTFTLTFTKNKTFHVVLATPTVFACS